MTHDAMMPVRRHFIARCLGWLVAGVLAATTPPSTFGAARSSERSLLVIGDSISAGYGLPRDVGWVKLLDERLRRTDRPWQIVNASVSGETTSGGLARIDELLSRVRPSVVIIELGGNDGLRGLALDGTRRNLEAMVERSQRVGAKVLLVGMQLPPNYGKPYTDRFAAIYPAIAERYKTALTPFFFEGFATRPDWFQPDRIHPTQAAQERLLENVWPALEPLLK